MKAILCNKWGGPEVLEVKEINAPQPNENELLIKVKAVAVNYADLVMLKGQYQTVLTFRLVLG